ncbi:MAG TPA: dienelactone hydrolase family protein [Candidatus Lustribacter sp.]|jgi:carboxymethylenebutenolidase|nr:dienelactone hydrolase family protein [Candidatus Lustribacter sp.]
MQLEVREDAMERKTAADFPQELIDLFQLYVHGEIDRAAFLNGAGKFAVGGLTAAGLLAALKPNYAWAMQVAPDDKRIHAEYAVVPSPQGNGTIKGYLARPATASATAKVPVIIVIHENRGLNPYIEDVARRLATAGYMAFAPDGLTSVGGYPGDEEKATALFQTVDKAKMTEDFVAAAQWLKARPESNGRLGAVGFCFGGGIANVLAVRLPDLSAAVPFYGTPPGPPDVPAIKAAVLVHHAGLDTRLADTWPSYNAELTAANVRHDGYIYPNVNHGFHNDTTPRYDKAAATLAWQRTLAWFDKYVRG